jgi:hypothetical protein
MVPKFGDRPIITIVQRGITENVSTLSIGQLII